MLVYRGERGKLLMVIAGVGFEVEGVGVPYSRVNRRLRGFSRTWQAWHGGCRGHLCCQGHRLCFPLLYERWDMGRHEKKLKIMNILRLCWWDFKSQPHHRGVLAIFYIPKQSYTRSGTTPPPPSYQYHLLRNHLLLRCLSLILELYNCRSSYINVFVVITILM